MCLLLLIISCIWCLGYAIFARISTNPPITSISESYYRNYPFTLWCFITGFTLVPVWLEISPENYEFLAFLSCSALLFLGTVPRFLEDQTKAHYLCVSILITFAIIWMTLTGYWWLAIITLVLMGLAWYKYNLWAAEFIGFSLLYYNLFVSIDVPVTW